MEEAEVPPATLVLHLRRSRQKAKEAAAAEVASLLGNVGGHPLRGGPLSDRPGVAWVGFDEPAVPELGERLRHLGYSRAVELVRPSGDASYRRARWKGRPVTLVPVYDEPDIALRSVAPDQRSFLLECGDGVVRRIPGYRGGQGELEHRALPVVDARLLVNLAGPPRGRLLDPFAGAGGVVLAARAAGWTAWSVDSDPSLRHGLAELADAHMVGDAASLPIASGSVDAIATEPPFHPAALPTVVASVAELSRTLRPEGRATALVGAAQATAVRAAAEAAGLTLELDAAIDRKGTDVVCLCWRRG